MSRAPASLALGVALFGAVVLAAVVVPLVTGFDANRIDLPAVSQAPFSHLAWNSRHILGTDNLGRDMLTRMMMGTRLSLVLAGAGALLAMGFGVGTGLLAGLGGPRFDMVVSRLIDFQLAFPYILLAVAIASALRPSLPVLIALLALAGWVYFARVVRALTLAEKQKEYVMAASVLGASRFRIAVRYIMPNVLPSVAVIATLQMAGLVLVEATLSFLGMGVRPPTPSLGAIVLDGKTYISSAWWIITFPGIILLLTALGLNLISDALRKVLDPRLRI